MKRSEIKEILIGTREVDLCNAQESLERKTFLIFSFFKPALELTVLSFA